MLAELVRNIESVEELFALLKLDYDKHTVRVFRLHILRLFGELAERAEAREPPVTEEDRRVIYSSALLQAHDRYATGECSCGPPVFPGLRQNLVPVRLKR